MKRSLLTLTTTGLLAGSLLFTACGANEVQSALNTVSSTADDGAAHGDDGNWTDYGPDTDADTDVGADADTEEIEPLVSGPDGTWNLLALEHEGMQCIGLIGDGYEMVAVEAGELDHLYMCVDNIDPQYQAEHDGILWGLSHNETKGTSVVFGMVPEQTQRVGLSLDPFAEPGTDAVDQFGLDDPRVFAIEVPADNVTLLAINTYTDSGTQAGLSGSHELNVDLINAALR